MATWSIGEVARQAGVETSAVRYYEAAGLLPEPERRNGRRVYDDSAVQWLALIRLAKTAGFSLAEIRTLLHGFDRGAPPSARWRALAGRKLEEIRARIEEARAMERVLKRLVRCECPTLRDCGASLACGGAPRSGSVRDSRSPARRAGRSRPRRRRSARA